MGDSKNLECAFHLKVADLLNADSFGDNVLHSVLRWLFKQIAVQQAGKVTVQALETR